MNKLVWRTRQADPSKVCWPSPVQQITSAALQSASIPGTGMSWGTGMQCPLHNAPYPDKIPTKVYQILSFLNAQQS